MPIESPKAERAAKDADQSTGVNDPCSGGVEGAMYAPSWETFFVYRTPAENLVKKRGLDLGVELIAVEFRTRMSSPSFFVALSSDFGYFLIAVRLT